MFGKKQEYPNKTTLNLVIKERPANYYRKVLLGLLIGVIVIGSFAKFAVIDRLNAANELERSAISERTRYEQLVRDNAAFAEVRAEYEKYFTKVHDGAAYADCMDVLKLIEANLMINAGVQSATLSNNELSVVLTGIDLEQASAIVKALYANEMVSSVSVSSADTTIENTYSSVTMSVTLLVEGGEAQ